MKKLMAILLSVSCLVSFAACGTSSDESSGNADSPVYVQEGTSFPDAWGITLTAEAATSSGMTLTCTQKGGRAEGSLETGSLYWIEKKENNRWVEVQPITEPVWDMMAHLVPSGGTLKWELDWTWLYGELGEGTYRICKTFVDFKETGASESRNYCAEFEIK